MPNRLKQWFSHSLGIIGIALVGAAALAASLAFVLEEAAFPAEVSQ